MKKLTIIVLFFVGISNGMETTKQNNQKEATYSEITKMIQTFCQKTVNFGKNDTRFRENGIHITQTTKLGLPCICTTVEVSHIDEVKNTDNLLENEKKTNAGKILVLLAQSRKNEKKNYNKLLKLDNKTKYVGIHNKMIHGDFKGKIEWSERNYDYDYESSTNFFVEGHKSIKVLFIAFETLFSDEEELTKFINK